MVSERFYLISGGMQPRFDNLRGGAPHQAAQCGEVFVSKRCDVTVLPLGAVPPRPARYLQGLGDTQCVHLHLALLVH